MRFRILGSSSAGNSALICTDKCRVLLDAGFTGKRMEALLKQAEADLEAIDAIFITHEHSDHVTGLRGLTRRRPDIRIFANETTARVVQERVPRALNWQIFENGRPFRFNDLEVTPFSIPHDAYDPVGYSFCSGDGSPEAPRRSVCWLTDLGYVTPAARRHAAECDLLVVEANHDPDMLERCQSRSWGTKQRILGRHGHLSNQAAYDLLTSIEQPRWSHVCLAHISAECNSLDIVEKQFAPLRNGTRNLDIHIFDPASPAPGTEFNLRPHRPTGGQPPADASTAEAATARILEITATAESTLQTRHPGQEPDTAAQTSESTGTQRTEQLREQAINIRVTQIEIALNV